MSWNSGPCADDWDPQERNVVPESDDEELSEEELSSESFWGGSSHFHRYVNPANQRSYPDRSRGAVRD